MENEENYSKGSPLFSKGSPNYKSDLEFSDPNLKPLLTAMTKTKTSWREKGELTVFIYINKSVDFFFSCADFAPLFSSSKMLDYRIS